DNLAFNFHSVKKFIGGGVRYMGIVKADAYGHGAVDCARRLEREGIDWFGVALPKEGVELRKAGIRKRILCLGGFWKGQEKELLNYNLTPVIYQLEQARYFNDAAKERNSTAEIHVKVDTGMNRIGVRHDAIADFAANLRKFENLHLEGLMTHFAAADDLKETGFTDLQIARFGEAVESFEKNGFNPIYKDMANSPASVAHPGSHGNMVRLGGVIYGLGDDVLPKEIPNPDLRPVLSLYTKIAYLKDVPEGETLGYGRTYTLKRDSRIATVPIGYQDGYRRGLSNKAYAILRGTRVPIVGTISMDWTLLDVTDVKDAVQDDTVTLIGASNREKIAASDLAGALETISYEITCGISKRVERKVLAK
ncbi:MAG: alanine racemase, partial [Acidobacteria bacterium]|nr:alanine racemase [Acidobacteriota bacterium]